MIIITHEIFYFTKDEERWNDDTRFIKLNRHIKTLKQPWNNRINFLKVINKGKCQDKKMKDGKIYRLQEKMRQIYPNISLMTISIYLPYQYET